MRPALPIALLLLASILAGCTLGQTGRGDGLLEPTTPTPTQEVAPQPTTPEQRTTTYGVSVSPRPSDEENITTFFLEARAAGDAIHWAGDLRELRDEGSLPNQMAAAAKQQKFTPVIVATVFEQDEGKMLRPFNETNRARYLDDAVSFVQRHDVPYLGLGLEVNLLWERDPAAFDAFAAWYEDAYAAIKGASPDTRVFPVFQYEHLAGNHGGLLGGEPGAKAQWSLLERFPQRDLLGLTSYPGLVFADPEILPSDYYTQIRKHTDEPIAIVETGWFAETDMEGWETSPSEQAEYVERLFELTDPLDPALLVWLFLFDQPDRGAFSSMGLFSEDGGPRPAFHRWNDRVRG